MEWGDQIQTCIIEGLGWHLLNSITIPKARKQMKNWKKVLKAIQKGGTIGKKIHSIDSLIIINYNVIDALLKGHIKQENNILSPQELIIVARH